MYSKVRLRRTIPQYKTIIVEHQPELDVKAVGRLALEQDTGNGFVHQESERTRRYVDDVTPLTSQDL
jgi:hypothetical protein